MTKNDIVIVKASGKQENIKKGFFLIISSIFRVGFKLIFF